MNTTERARLLKKTTQVVDFLTRRVMMQCIKAKTHQNYLGLGVFEMATSTQNIKDIVTATVISAGERFRPIESNTRRILEETAERVKTTSTDQFRKLEDTIRQQPQLVQFVKQVEEKIPEQLTNLSDRISTQELIDRLGRILQTTLERLNLPSSAQIDSLESKIEELTRKLRSLERRLESRVMRKDLKPLATRVTKLEKADAE